MKYGLVILLLCSVVFNSEAQDATISGRVTDGAIGTGLEKSDVFIEGTSNAAQTNGRGEYKITGLKPGRYVLVAYFFGMQTKQVNVEVFSGNHEINFELYRLHQELQQVEVSDARLSNNGIDRLRSVEGTAIYEAKKSEVIVLNDLAANLSTNNARQIYAKVPGLNIWESDGAGLQLGIGARGLDPNRTSNFNVRQNGYDISADALGYPESYYTPPTEAIERIEVVRGAASLQYGTQFGGLLNFVMRKGPRDKTIELTSRQSIGSFGLFNTFNSIGGTKGKVSYYGFFQHKQGDGWRPNAAFDLNMGYGAVTYTPSDKSSFTAEFTRMYYLAKQSGGLTDVRFEEDPMQSIRSRNWFGVDWNLMAFSFDHKFSSQWKLNSRTFALIGGRDALGNLGRIDRADDDSNVERDLFVDDFQNIGNETRVMHRYNLMGNTSVMLAGVRYYRGFTHRRQGLGPDGDKADFRFLNPASLEGSDYDFPGNNLSVFGENIFNLTEKFSITPGLRFERIQTKAAGYYRDKVLRPNPETGIAEDSTFKVSEHKNKIRSFVIAGVGLSYKSTDNLEIYANFSQNYRAINFNDIRVVNPNLVVDPDIEDEKGYNMDIGWRGGKDGFFNFDVSVFYLRYRGRIGSILKVDTTNYRIYRYRTNVADSRHLGIEAFGQLDILKALSAVNTPNALIIFGNIAFIEAHYVQASEESISGNKVELVPNYNAKAGLTFQRGKFQTTIQGAFTSQQFSDASNAPSTPSAVEGIIPAYHVMDLSAKYTYRFLTLEAGVNNLTDEMYFTRRASGYPGPGILPSDGRSFYLTLQVKI